MSLSSARSDGSIVTRFTSCWQVITTLTRPAPDCPSTSISANSSCAFFRLSCICCACFMRPASWFFIMGAMLQSSRNGFVIESAVGSSRRSARARRARTARCGTRPRPSPAARLRARFSCAASDVSATAPTSNASSHLRPVAWSSATLSLSEYALSARCLCAAGQRQRQHVAGDRLELGLRRELRGHGRQLERRDERRPLRRHRWAAQPSARASVAGAAGARRRWRCGRRRPGAPRRAPWWSPAGAAARLGDAAFGLLPRSGSNARRRNNVIEKPVASSGASARSARPWTQI